MDATANKRPTWPGPAQIACAALLVVALAAVGWRWAERRFAAKPTELEAGAAFATIDPNRAGESELRQLPNVGEKTAEKIVAHREEHGPYRTGDDLRDVPGVGDKTMGSLQRWVRVEGAALQQGDGPGEPAFATFQEPPEDAVRLARKPNDTKSAGGLIDINTATMAELDTLPGIGPVLAERIIAERTKSPFRSVDDLHRVNGIGAKTVEKIRPLVQISHPDG